MCTRSTSRPSGTSTRTGRTTAKSSSGRWPRAIDPGSCITPTRAGHFDNYPNEKYAGKSPARTVFSDAMVESDDILGRLVRALEETGQLENTLIVFTSDNGPEGEVPPHGRSPFRGHKGSSWEGGVRVPTFAYWKGAISPRKSDGLFDLADLFNTCISIAGAPGAEVTKLLTQGPVRRWD